MVMQVPLYPPAIFQTENDGEGLSFVLYFRLSESFYRELPIHFQENLRVCSACLYILIASWSDICPFYSWHTYLQKVNNLRILG